MKTTTKIPDLYKDIFALRAKLELNKLSYEKKDISIYKYRRIEEELNKNLGNLRTRLKFLQRFE